MDTRSLVQQIMDTTSTWLDEQLRSDGRQSEPQATCRPLLGHWMADPSSAHLASVQNWCHPFGSRANALQQLIQQAKAERGYYPLGRNGYWHLGVHFDVGTAGTMDQAYVRCLADGEVVAYRIDTQSPCTTYHLDGEPVERVFSRNFVLVRHRLQAPEISGVDDTPPSLTFFSLYMHLQDWEPYAESPELSRPGFWPLAARYQVNPNVRDTHAGSPGVVGLRVRNQATRGKVIGLLPHGTAVTINGQGDFREWIDSPGPVALQNPDGSLRGYVAFSNLRPNASGSYRVQLNQDNSTLNVRAEPNGNSEVLFKLPQGTEVTISGEGQFRKLERVNQYLHYASLMSEREPDALDRILVLDKPVPIRAGELIGHLGNYQDLEDVVPQQQLHLEVFSHEDVEAFMDVSRAWAKHLPASSRTWLTLPQGTSVVPHQEYFSVAGPPSVGVDTPTSAAELHLPKQQLDGLGAEKTLRIPARNGEDGCTWYRLDDLLHDVEGLLLKGWVRVEDNNAQWHSPWDWSGYAAILNGDSLESCQAYALKVQGILPSEKDRARAAQLADLSDRGPIRNRLFDLIGRGPNPGEVMSAEQLQQALRLPAQAQSVSRLAIYSESDWYWRPGKWDVLDDLYGHRSSAPHINWLAEKERIENLSWWQAVAPNLALPTDGQVWHLHPIGMMGSFSEFDFSFTLEVMRKLYPALGAERYKDLQDIAEELNSHLVFYKLDTHLRRAHFFAQILQETGLSLRVEEDLSYRVSALISKFSYFKSNPDEANLHGFVVLQGKIKADGMAMGIEDFKAIANGAYGGQENLGNTGVSSGDGWKYRGRGLKHLTGRYNYQKFTEWHQKNSALWPSDDLDFIASPDFLVRAKYAARSAAYFWLDKKLYERADKGSAPFVVDLITDIVNRDTDSRSRRKQNFNQLWVEEVLK
ncbi:hypothetical protein TUM18999_59130 [Pseudomonas tohonis]|uniref:Chitinase n=1 Tax=Pseudomonas tohonis TaxID=2725477 RepID=A0A6J4EDA1_9PSED|nr:hypothetical protein [Pseudomonas tohonis]BCG27722.1 hypothetical protein TUM18999_59130 [Pseudomonas tohonis]GJN54147.1 hypothetical protein TUM20286_38990 [Pseudomonas tohonis]